MKHSYRLLVLLVFLLGLGIVPAVAQEEIPDFSQVALDDVQVVEWVAPSGSISTIGNPVYQWKPVAGATSYQMYVGKNQNPFYLPTKFYGVIDASLCTADLCSVELTTQNNLDPFGVVWLNNDDYAVFIKPDNGDWEGPFTFTVATQAPSVPTALTGTATGFTWSLDSTSVLAAFFQIYIAPSDELGNPVASLRWVSRNEACGGWEGTSCTFNLAATLINGKTYNIYLQSWGAGGYSTGGNVPSVDGWIECKFLPEDGTCLLPPTEPTNLNAKVTNAIPTLTWTNGEHTTGYILWLGIISEDGVTTSYFSNEVLPVADLGCANSGQTCTFTLNEALNRGIYSWFILATGPGGVPANALSGYVPGPLFTVSAS